MHLNLTRLNLCSIQWGTEIQHTNFFFLFPIGRHSIRRPLATTKASGDLFIMGAPDRQVTVTPYEGTDSFTSMPYLGFEPGTLGVAVGSPIHYTSWSAYSKKHKSILFHLQKTNILYSLQINIHKCKQGSSM